MNFGDPQVVFCRRSLLFFPDRKFLFFINLDSSRSWNCGVFIGKKNDGLIAGDVTKPLNYIKIRRFFSDSFLNNKTICFVVKNTQNHHSGFTSIQHTEMFNAGLLPCNIGYTKKYNSCSHQTA